ncbi:hypothetical protein ACEQ8H_004335 [Pleosporales sp. CAS-2024a]
MNNRGSNHPGDAQVHRHDKADYIKIESTPSPELLPWSDVPPVVHEPQATPLGESTAIVDARDPEGFLRRCSGFNKSKRHKERCSAVIGKKSEQTGHPTFLPTCRAHRDQQSFAGWCRYKKTGQRCGRLFRWTPPYFELCDEHREHPDTPCYMSTLPLELREEILRYLLPDRPIGSFTAVLHTSSQDHVPDAAPGYRAASQHRNPTFTISLDFAPPDPSTHPGTTVFPMPVLNLFLVSRQFYRDTKNLLFSTVPFTIDVRKDGTFMCGRRLLEPRRADGSSHLFVDEADEAKTRFLRYFDWAAVKLYVVHILVENWASLFRPDLDHTDASWDEEVELYDIRDYVSVVVSGVLAKSAQLNKLSVRLCLSNFSWSPAEVLANTKIIVGPFESLRNVRQPQILSISMGKPAYDSTVTIRRNNKKNPPICSVPPLPTHNMPTLLPGMPELDAYAQRWTQCVSSSSPSALTPKSPMRAMFTAFKDFYTQLATLMPDMAFVPGRRAFLHRARVARETENVEQFRRLRNDVIGHWCAYLEREEARKRTMERRLSKMLDVDVYPGPECDDARNEQVVLQLLRSKRVAALAAAATAADSGRDRLGPRNGVHASTTDGGRGLDVGGTHDVDQQTIDCFSNVNLNAGWYAEAGPSTKKQRVDSRHDEAMVVREKSPRVAWEVGEQVVYRGKGKARMKAEPDVI